MKYYPPGHPASVCQSSDNQLTTLNSRLSAGREKKKGDFHSCFQVLLDALPPINSVEFPQANRPSRRDRRRSSSTSHVNVDQHSPLRLLNYIKRFLEVAGFVRLTIWDATRQRVSGHHVYDTSMNTAMSV